MAITGGKRRENRPVWYGNTNSSGQSYSIGDWLTFINPIGTTNCISIGNGSAIPLGLTAAIALGISTNATGSYAIALGASAVAGANTMIVGDNTNLLRAIHQFTVRGHNGGVLDTISAIDNPASEAFGLTLVYNADGTFSNKTVKGLVSPPVGAILLYVDP